MTHSPPRVMLKPRDEPCVATTVWHPESALLQTMFQYPVAATRASRPLAERLNDQLGIRPRPRRIMLGDVEVAFDAEHRLEAIEVRTNPASWTGIATTQLPSELEQVWLDLQVEYDVNQFASVQVPIAIGWNESERTVAIECLPPPQNVRWYAIADKALAGVDANGRLAGFRLMQANVAATTSSANGGELVH